MSTADKRLTEADWLRQVTELAELYGFTWAHFRPAHTSKGWRTPVQGPGGVGFPDLVLWRERVIFAELKAQRSRPVAAEQVLRHDELRRAGAEVYLWRPGDFDQVHETFRRRET